MLPCVSIAPFETPVVPPVYWRKARSSWVRGGLLEALAAPCAITSPQATAPGSRNAGTIFFTCFTTRLVTSDFGKPSMSPMRVVTTVFPASSRSPARG
jgi:hypothetical protein